MGFRSEYRDDLNRREFEEKFNNRISEIEQKIKRLDQLITNRFIANLDQREVNAFLEGTQGIRGATADIAKMVHAFVNTTAVLKERDTLTQELKDVHEEKSKNRRPGFF